jgi:hypothetical protein
MMIRSVVGAALAAGLLTAGAAEAVTMTAVVKGTITSGYDQTGEFGAAETDLTGAGVTVTYTFDPDLAPIRNTPGTGYDEAYGGAAYGTADWPSLLAEVTIGGVTKTLTGSFYGIFGIYDVAYGGYDLWNVTVYDFDDGNISGVNETSYVQTVFYDYSDFLPEGLEDPFHLTALPNSAYQSSYFQFVRYDYTSAIYTDYAYGSFTIDSIRVTSGVAPVPLPATGFLLVAGLAGLAAARRRRG